MMGRRLLSLGLVLLLAGCGTNSFLGRRVDNFTAYYNTFYNARKAFERGVKARARDDVPIDRDRYLPIFSDPERAAKSKDFEDAIKKSADVLRDHPRSKWVDDALLLIGKAYFYQQNYVGAEQKFREVIELGSDLEDEGRFWLARTLIAGQAFEEAAAHLQESLAREGLDRDWAAMLHLALGELYVKRGDWEAAAAELEQGLAHVPDKDIGARAQFLLGQVYETMGRYEEAVAAFDRVQKFNPLYELGYAARYSAIRVQGLHLDGAAALKRLRKMERDDKHYGYRGDLAYLRGRILQAVGRGEEAREVYLSLLYNDDPTLDISRVKGRIHYALGELYRDAFNDYVLAAAYYDSAAVAIRPPAARGATASRGAGAVSSDFDPDLFTAEAILDSQERREQFGNYARVYKEVARMDSLLALGQMPEQEFDAFILELRKQRAREQAEQRRLMEQRRIEQRFRQNNTAANQQNTNQNNGLPAGKVVPGVNAPRNRGDAGFLYHRDPVRLQEARATFLNRWGERPRVPNWRRLDAISGQGETPLAEVSSDVAPETEGDAVGALPQIDVSGVPRDSLSQARMRAARAMARYELANVLFLGMEAPDSAAVWYRMVIEEDGDQPVAQRAYYALAEVQRALGDEETARRLYEQVLAAYPDSDFARRIRRQLHREVEEQVDSLALAEAAYEQAYRDWQAQRYEAALNEMVHTAGRFPTTEVTPRALLAAGAVYTEWAVRDGLDLFAPLPLAVPDSLLQRSGLVEPPPPALPDTLAMPPPEPDTGDGAGTDRLEIPGMALPADTLAQQADTLATVPEADPPAAVPAALPAPVEAPPGVTLETLYQTLAVRHTGTPYATYARRLLAVLEEYRPVADTLASDSLAAALTGFTDSLQALPDPLAIPTDTLVVAGDSARVAPVPAQEAPEQEEKRTLAPAEIRERLLRERKEVEKEGAEEEGAPRRQRGLLRRVPPVPDPAGAKPPATPPGAAAADTVAGPVWPLEEVDTPPTLVGGMEGLRRTLRYPAEAARQGIKGEVVVRFVVDEQGQARALEVVRGLGAGCDEEAVRALGQARFTPAMAGGRPVKVRMTLAVPFTQ